MLRRLPIRIARQIASSQPESVQVVVDSASLQRANICSPLLSGAYPKLSRNLDEGPFAIRTLLLTSLAPLHLAFAVTATHPSPFDGL